MPWAIIVDVFGNFLDGWGQDQMKYMGSAWDNSTVKWSGEDIKCTVLVILCVGNFYSVYL